MNKKAIAYEFLLRLIIAILFVIAAIYIGKSLFSLTDSAFDSYLKFVSEVNKLENGQFKEVGVDFDKETAIIGFGKDAGQFECYNCIYESIEKKPRAIFKKPSNLECKNKACICLCREGLSGTEISGATTEFSCSSLTCRNLKDDLDVIDRYDAKRENRPSLEAYWKGGFVYGRNIINGLLNNMESYLPRTMVLRIENHNNIIAVCSSGKKECLSSADKTELDQRIKEKAERKLRAEAEKQFEEFIVFLKRCKEDTRNCTGTREFVSKYNIFYIPPEKTDYGIYLVNQSNEINILKRAVIKKNEISISLFKNEAEKLEGDIFKNNKAEFSSKNGNIIVSR